MNYRKKIVDKLIPYFEKDERYYLLIGDMGFGTIDQMKTKMPDRMVNCGIMEQGMVGIAAGMALSGMIPIVYSIVNFLCFRALEQMRNDVVLQNLNVKFIGTGANDYFKFLGNSHCCGQDDIEIMKLIDMDIWNPYIEGINSQTEFSWTFNDLIEDWLDSDKAGYIRV